MDQGTKQWDAKPWQSPQSVHGLAEEVVAVIGSRQVPQMQVRISVLDLLITQVLTRGLFDAGRVASLMRDQRMSDLETINTYIPAAARRLGQMWSEDIVGFAEVSIGTARLQALAHEVSCHWSMETTRDAPQDLSLLLFTPHGEDHTLGAVTLCTLLRRRGYQVDLHLNATRETILTEASGGRYDIVMTSCSRSEGLASLTGLFKDVRARSEHPPVLVVGGVVLDHMKNVQQLTGADLATRDIHQVLKLAISRRKGRISVVS